MSSTPRKKRTRADLRPYDPDLLTITAARRRPRKPIVHAAEICTPSRRRAPAQQASMPDKLPPPPRPTTDEGANVYKAWLYARLARARLDFLDGRALYGVKCLGEPVGQSRSEIDSAREAWIAAYEALLRAPAPSLQSHGLKRDRSVCPLQLQWMRKNGKEWAKLIDDEFARLSAGKRKVRVCE